MRRLDKLTQEEARMASAEGLKATHAVDQRVRGVAEQLIGVDDRVVGVDNRLRNVGDLVDSVNERVRAVDDKVTGVIDGAQFTLSRLVDKLLAMMQLDGQDAKAALQQTADDVVQVKRSAFPSLIGFDPYGSL